MCMRTCVCVHVYVSLCDLLAVVSPWALENLKLQGRSNQFINIIMYTQQPNFCAFGSWEEIY
jgi:hypothetical protein